MVLEKVKSWLLELVAVAAITAFLMYAGVPLEYVVLAVVAYSTVLAVYNRVQFAAMRTLSKFAKDKRAFIGDLLVSLAVALGIFLVVVIIVGILMAQSYVAGQTVANQINDTATRDTLTTTWSQIFTLYSYFGTWSPIIFITIFGGIAIAAIYTFVAGRRERGGEGGAI